MSKLPTLIGLSGPAGSGKDTVRSILEGAHGYHGLALADPIRAMITALLTTAGIDIKYAHARELKELNIPGLGISYRRLAQTIGTEWGRNTMDTSFWTRIAQARLQELTGDTFGAINFVVSDIRFESDASERGIPFHMIDHVIFNDGSLAELAHLVDFTLSPRSKAPHA
jgi:hypothetical protein